MNENKPPAHSVVSDWAIILFLPAFIMTNLVIIGTFNDWKPLLSENTRLISLMVFPLFYFSIAHYLNKFEAQRKSNDDVGNQKRRKY